MEPDQDPEPAAKGIYDFQGSDSEELSFKRGSVLKIIDSSDPNWLKAELNGQQGSVPANYIEMLPQDWYKKDLKDRREAEEILLQKDQSDQFVQPEGAFLVRKSTQKKGQGEFSISVRSGNEVQHFKIARQGPPYTYSVWEEQFSTIYELIEFYRKNSVARQIDSNTNVNIAHLLLRDMVKSLPKRAAQAQSVQQPQFQQPQMQQQQFAQSKQSAQPNKLAQPQQYSQPQQLAQPVAAPQARAPPPQAVTQNRVQAFYQYQASTSEELSLQPGDVITILKNDDPNWWWGELRGKQGFFPATYVKPI